MDATIIAYSKQRSLFNKLETIANNVANADTSGFKADLSIFLKDAKKIDGERNPAPKMLMATDLSQGTFKATGNPLDVAIEGNGFFQVETPLGIRYTKSGSFTINETGQLITNQGYIVQGGGGAITFDPADTEIKIDKNGEISALNNRELTIRGQLGVFSFEDNSKLKKVGNSTFTSEEEGEAAEIGTYRVSQGTIEQSNVNSISQITDLIDVTRGVQQVAKIIDTQYQLERNSISRIAGTQ